MSSIVLQIKTDAHEERFERSSTNQREWAREMSTFFRDVASGNVPASIERFADDTTLAKASGTITVASILADDTITIAGVTITGKASPSGESQFDSDGTNSVVATAIATCINAHTSLTGIVTASASSAVVTVTAFQAGLMGNAVPLASSNGTRLAVSAAFLASGTGAGESSSTYSFGK